MADQVTSVDIPATFGALLLGGLFATLLSGMVQVQTLWYFRCSHEDPKLLSAVVVGVALLDLIHLSFIWAAVWDYSITKFGQPERIDEIYWSISLSVVITALLTILVHGFFASRIFLLSHRNFYLVIPIVVVAIVRVISACSTAGTMLYHKSFHLFKEYVAWLFTTGLSLSTAVDIMIAVAMAVLLSKNRKEAPSMVPVINNLMMYTFETGLLTTAGTVISMFFWVFKSHNNLTFLGLHFVIAKFYATSILVTLNLRNSLKTRRQAVWTLGSNGRRQVQLNSNTNSAQGKPLEISIQKTVELQGQGPNSHPSGFSSPRDMVKFGDEAFDNKSETPMVPLKKQDAPETHPVSHWA